MKINPVLRNESKLAVRTVRFTIMIFIFIAIISFGVMLYYNSFNKLVFTEGLRLKSGLTLYSGMAVGQAVLLMFIVPSLTATAISSEREKQTLDILLSSRLTPIQIILGKLMSSSLRVIMLIFCTMPLYAMCGLIGGVRLNNIFELVVVFIINTFFVGSIGIFFSTFVKSSKAATALTYGVVFLVYLGIIVGLYMVFTIGMSIGMGNPNSGNNLVITIVAYFSPVVGFIAMLIKQVGAGTEISYGFSQIGLKENAYYISIAIQITITCILTFLSAKKLNPIKKTRKQKIIESKELKN